MKKRFRLNRRNGKIMGVCAGISDATGWDLTVIRVAVVLVTLAGLFPWTLIAYAVAAWVAKSPAGLPGYESRPKLRTSTYQYQNERSDLDRRLEEVDRYVATSDSDLAREIERLR